MDIKLIEEADLKLMMDFVGKACKSINRLG